MGRKSVEKNERLVKHDVIGLTLVFCGFFRVQRKLLLQVLKLCFTNLRENAFTF